MFLTSDEKVLEEDAITHMGYLAGSTILNLNE